MINFLDNIYEEVKQEIGFVFFSNGKIVIGFSFDEVKLFMLKVINILELDNSFYQEVECYFVNLFFDVFKIGVQLEIGIDSNKMFVNVEDFVKYWFVFVNFLVVGYGIKFNCSYCFVIVDIVVVKEVEYEILKFQKEVYKEFIKFIGDIDWMDMVLWVFNVNFKKFDVEDKELCLEKIFKLDLVGFLGIVINKDLEIISMINECISKEILCKVGNVIFNVDENIGNNMDEVVLYLKDKQNFGVYMMFKVWLEFF